MQNGSVNGAGAPAMQPHTVTVNPAQCAAAALQFLPRCPHTQAEREAYDMACMFLQAIVTGQVMLAPAPTPQAQPQVQAADDAGATQ